MQADDALLLLDEIQDHFHEITEISKQQQQTLASGVLSDLEDLFDRRRELFSGLIHSLNIVHEYLNKNEQFRTLEGVEQKIIHLNESLANVFTSDEKVQELLSLRLERVQIRQSEKYKVKHGIRNYRDIEKETGVVSRIFLGNSRYFDDKR